MRGARGKFINWTKRIFNFSRTHDSNIVLVGLIYDNNLGDQAIYQCSLNIIKEINVELGLKTEIRSVDLHGRRNPEYYKQKGIKKFTRRVFRKIKYIYNGLFIKNEEAIICNDLRRACRKNIDKHTVALIFVGGGLIKYRDPQIILSPIITVLKQAQHYEIPVMFSAVGVEGYNKFSEKCIGYKKALNYLCIKHITTRDDLYTLQNCYINRDGIRMVQVADPACGISRMFPCHTNKKKIIGLGIARAGLFQDFGTDIEDDVLLGFWCSLYELIISSGYECRLFTNGSIADYLFAEKVADQIGVGSLVIRRPTAVKELIDDITSFSGMVVTRLHAGIIGYSYQVPFVGIVWNPKQVLFGECIGHSEYFINPQDLSPGFVFRRLQGIMACESTFDNKEYCDSTGNEIKLFLKRYVLSKCE